MRILPPGTRAAARRHASSAPPTCIYIGTGAAGGEERVCKSRDRWQQRTDARAMDRGLARIANELSILESVPPPRRGADIDFSTRPADPSRAWTPGQGRRAVTVPTASVPPANNKAAPSPPAVGPSASARSRARPAPSNGGKPLHSSLDGAGFSGLEIGGTAVHARPSSCACSGHGVHAAGGRAPAGSRDRRNFKLAAPAPPASATPPAPPGGAASSGATNVPKPTGMERARVWSEEVEDAYRLQEAGYRDEVELLACGQPPAERWCPPPRRPRASPCLRRPQPLPPPSNASPPKWELGRTLVRAVSPVGAGTRDTTGEAGLRQVRTVYGMAVRLGASRGRSSESCDS